MGRGLVLGRCVVGWGQDHGLARFLLEASGRATMKPRLLQQGLDSPSWPQVALPREGPRLPLEEQASSCCPWNGCTKRSPS